MVKAAAQEADPGRQALQFAHIRIGAFVDILQAGQFEQQAGEGVLPIFRTGRQGLQDQHIGVTVHDETGETVGFGMDEAESIRGMWFLPGEPRR